MATGREALDELIDEEASFFQEHGSPPRLVRLPVLMAWDIAKCGYNDLGELSGRILKDGIDVLEDAGLFGMKVQIVREPNAELTFE